ncbi:hypothetical protein ACIBH1_44955 [Nonomuraea sp. NPDC050663]|uniref:hypothetical protein n=1 Tax=Nonomuraea sp. NPDC050663 TaxID=3364370 RepID=UPI0037A42C6A
MGDRIELTAHPVESLLDARRAVTLVTSLKRSAVRRIPVAFEVALLLQQGGHDAMAGTGSSQCLA